VIDLKVIPCARFACRVKPFFESFFVLFYFWMRARAKNTADRNDVSGPKRYERGKTKIDRSIKQIEQTKRERSFLSVCARKFFLMIFQIFPIALF
jgi:hypothetical protein